ncbi:MAG: glycosyltransferase family A protein [Nanoarchaeota archaeon]
MSKVTIVVPTYNEEKDIGECLKSLRKQSYKDFERIIVDDGSNDKTIEIVKRFSEVRIIKGQHRGPGFSRNLGAKKAKGEILVFIDSDMTFDRDYIKNLVNPLLKNKKILGTTHDYELVKNTDNIWSRCWGKVRVSKKDANEVKIFRAIRKNRFIELGGFEPKYGYADDQTFWFKYKLRPAVAKNTTCYHKNPETLKAVFKQSKWIGASLDNFLFEIPILNYMLPLLMVLIGPIVIIFLAFKKCIKNKDFSVIHYMIVFLFVRYFGTIAGLSRKIYQGINLR